MRIPIKSVFASTLLFFVAVVCFASNAPAKAQIPPHPAPQAAVVVEPQPVIQSMNATEAPVPAPTPVPAPAAPRKHTYNSCNVESSTVAMTFDDGPHPKLTPKLLDMLKERNIKATFFVIGKCVAEYPDIAKRIVAVLAPKWLRIGAYWYPRGGMPIDVLWQTGAPPKGLWLPEQGVPAYRGRG